jgi:hypothetical protein
MPTTDVFWEVDGVSLQEIAWNIETLGGARRTVPGWRGSDRKYAYRAGAAPRLMVADSRTITLAMWCTGWRNNDADPAHIAWRYEDNRRALERLFWRPDGQLVALTKRWWQIDGGISRATGTGRVVSDMAPTMQGPHKGKFAVDLFMPDPWFYGPQETVSIDRGSTQTVPNSGDDACTHMTVNFHGPLTNPVLTNLTASPNIVLALDGDIDSGHYWTVDVDDATVTRNVDNSNQISRLSHSGSRAWMRLGRFGNELRLTADAGSGHAVVLYNPAHF